MSSDKSSTLTDSRLKSEGIAIFWMLLLILFVRSIITQPFRIPSGSMIPTLLIGDQLFVVQSSYDMGVHVPLVEIDRKIIPISDPKRGDVVVFRNQHRQNDLDTYYIKRLIGLPADKIKISRGRLEINGEAVPQTPIDDMNFVAEMAPDFQPEPNIYRLFRERLPGMDHDFWVQRRKLQMEAHQDSIKSYEAMTGTSCIEVAHYTRGEYVDRLNTLVNEICLFEVPENHYFFMGDNRDDSFDGRAWGFVPREALIGRAAFIWLPRTEEPLLGFKELFNYRRFGLRVL